MKTEHEMLKEICDLIWYKENRIDYCYVWDYDMIANLNSFVEFKNSVEEYRILNVREVIFTQDFMDKLALYINKNLNKSYNLWDIILKRHLNNPTQYLYNLLFKN